MNSTLTLISSRRSHRAYQPQQITEEQLQALLKAAVDSPSAVNRQPWHFTAVQNQELLDQVNQATREAAMSKDPSARSPRFADDTFHVFYHAPTVIFISGDPKQGWVGIDCGIAVENIAIAAESMGLGSVILGLPREAFLGKKADELQKALDFPEGYEFIIAIAVGTPADDKPAHPVDDGKITIIR